MKGFLKTYLVVFGIISGILLFFGFLFWWMSKIFGENGPIIASTVVLTVIFSFFITAAIEAGQ